MKIFVSAGHTLNPNKGCGAVGFINESQENRVLAKYIVNYLKKLGHEADYHEVNSGSDYISQQTQKANEKKYDVVVQIHFNSSDNATANGTEVIYRSSKGKVFAQRVQDKLKTEFKDRKIKHDINDLSQFILISAITTSIIPILETIIVNNLAQVIEQLIIVAIISAIFIFGIPSFMLATASPIAVKLKNEEEKSGKCFR